LAGERILVVDDSLEIQEIIRGLILEPAGYRVLTASEGPEGLRLALEEQPDLIILDEQLPGLTGLGILRALREQGCQTPVIFMSAHGSENLVVQAFRLGVHDYVIKPFEPQEMARSVEHVANEIRLRQERDQLLVHLRAVNQQLQQQVQELNTLYSIGQSVTSQLDLRTVLTRVVEAAVFLTRAEEGLLLLRESDSGDLVLRAAKNIDEKQARGLRVRVEDSLAGQVMRSGEAALVVSGQAKVATGYLVQSLIYAPLRTPEHGVLGILGVANRETERAFTTHDVRLLCALANYAAVALDNARLYEQTEAERRKLEAVLRETDEAVIILDPQMNVLLCNAAASVALELPVDVIGRPLNDLVAPLSLRDLLEAGQRTNRTLHAEVTVRGGRVYNAQLNPVTGVGYALMMQDITHLKELDRIKSEFVSIVSHDLRTPLTTIRGYVDLLGRVGPLNDQQQVFVQRVGRSVTHITELISNLLDLGRIEAGYDLAMEPLHLERIVDAVVDEFRPRAEAKRQELRWELKPLPLIRGNPQRLRQAVANLLSNAIKFTGEGGWVAVDVAENEEHVVVRVADNGVGIPLADQPYIFERFHRVEREGGEEIEGTGLGLAIVRSVIDKHHGRIWVESRPGEGSVFTFVLPTME